MTKVLVSEQHLADIASAIRSRSGAADRYTPGEMASAVQDIPRPAIEPLAVTANGSYPAPEGVDGYAPVTVDVQPKLQQKTVNENGTVLPDSGYDGLESVTVDVAGSVSPNALLLHCEDEDLTNAGSWGGCVLATATQLTYSTDQAKFGSGSMRCTGSSGDAKRVLYMPRTFRFGKRDFTIDMWLYMSSSRDMPVLGFVYRSIGVWMLSSARVLNICLSSNGSSWQYDVETTIAAGSIAGGWHHLAICRNGGTVYGFVDGVKVSTITVGEDFSLYDVAQNLTIGSNNKNANDFDGYFDEVRVILDRCVWTEDFTPPAQPYV